ncbi:MAG TPA: hypothetical protein VIM62_06575, partial [Acidobacteriaceae bacterium]
FYSLRHDEAKRYYGEAAHAGELPMEARFFRTLSAIEAGEGSDAIPVAESILRYNGAPPSYLVAAAELLALAGERANARALCEKHGFFQEGAKVSRFRRATLALALQEDVLAMELLEAAYRGREAELPWLHVDPRLARLRNNTSFLALDNAVFGDSANALPGRYS